MMKKENLIKIPHLSISRSSNYQNDQVFNSQIMNQVISQELETAIQLLINQLRNVGPICSKNK